MSLPTASDHSSSIPAPACCALPSAVAESTRPAPGNSGLSLSGLIRLAKPDRLRIAPEGIAAPAFEVGAERRAPRVYPAPVCAACCCWNAHS